MPGVIKITAGGVLQKLQQCLRSEQQQVEDELFIFAQSDVVSRLGEYENLVAHGGGIRRTGIRFFTSDKARHDKVKKARRACGQSETLSDLLAELVKAYEEEKKGKNNRSDFAGKYLLNSIVMVLAAQMLQIAHTDINNSGGKTIEDIEKISWPLLEYDNSSERRAAAHHLFEAIKYLIMLSVAPQEERKKTDIPIDEDILAKEPYHFAKIVLDELFQNRDDLDEKNSGTRAAQCYCRETKIFNNC